VLLGVQRPSGSALFPYTPLFRSGYFSDGSMSMRVMWWCFRAMRSGGGPCGVRGENAGGVNAAAPSGGRGGGGEGRAQDIAAGTRSEEHTSELQSRENIVCRLLLE